MESAVSAGVVVALVAVVAWLWWWWWWLLLAPAIVAAIRTPALQIESSRDREPYLSPLKER